MGISIWTSCKPMPLPPATPNSLSYEAAPAPNPLRGFLPFKGDYGDAFPHSMEYDTLPLRDLMTGENSFDFASLEASLAEVSSRSNHLVLRVYLDSPGKPLAIPEFLIDAGVTLRSYEEHGGGKSPDYDDERVVSALERFIAAFGEKYDGDPRFGFVTLGLIGFWGEWHTYPHEEWMPGFGTQSRVLQAYAKAFQQTQLTVRQPMADSTTLPIGYHDDSFTFSTLPGEDWHFVPRLIAAGATNTWKSNVIGGEIQPELQINIWKRPIPDDPPSENFDECVAATHVSWLINQKAFTPELSGEARQRALAGARSIGYEYHVTEALLPSIRVGSELVIELSVENRGAAPFYYEWPIELRVTDPSGSVSVHQSDFKVQRVLPGAPMKWTIKVAAELAAGEHSCAVRVVPPGSLGRPFVFANKESGVGGWLDVGKIGVFD